MSVENLHFIGVDGAQGSGKTTYISKLMKEWPDQDVISIETDDFKIARHLRDDLPRNFFENPNNYRRLYDFGVMRGVLNRIRAVGSVSVSSVYNPISGRRDRAHTWEVSEGGLVIVGGPFLLESEFDGLFETKILLDVPVEERWRRFLTRQRSSRSEAEQRKVFDDFECFYNKYWDGREHLYDEVITN